MDWTILLTALFIPLIAVVLVISFFKAFEHMIWLLIAVVVPHKIAEFFPATSPILLILGLSSFGIYISIVICRELKARKYKFKMSDFEELGEVTAQDVEEFEKNKGLLMGVAAVSSIGSSNSKGGDYKGGGGGFSGGGASGKF